MEHSQQGHVPSAASSPTPLPRVRHPSTLHSIHRANGVPLPERPSHAEHFAYRAALGQLTVDVLRKRHPMNLDACISATARYNGPVVAASIEAGTARALQLPLDSVTRLRTSTSPLSQQGARRYPPFLAERSHLSSPPKESSLGVASPRPLSPSLSPSDRLKRNPRGVLYHTSSSATSRAVTPAKSIIDKDPSTTGATMYDGPPSDCVSGRAGDLWRGGRAGAEAAAAVQAEVSARRSRVTTASQPSAAPWQQPNWRVRTLQSLPKTRAALPHCAGAASSHGLGLGGLYATADGEYTYSDMNDGVALDRSVHPRPAGHSQSAERGVDRTADVSVLRGILAAVALPDVPPAAAAPAGAGSPESALRLFLTATAQHTRGDAGGSSDLQWSTGSGSGRQVDDGGAARAVAEAAWTAFTHRHPRAAAGGPVLRRPMALSTLGNLVVTDVPVAVAAAAGSAPLDPSRAWVGAPPWELVERSLWAAHLSNVMRSAAVVSTPGAFEKVLEAVASCDPSASLVSLPKALQLGLVGRPSVAAAFPTVSSISPHEAANILSQPPGVILDALRRAVVSPEGADPAPAVAVWFENLLLAAAKALPEKDVRRHTAVWRCVRLLLAAAVCAVDRVGSVVAGNACVGEQVALASCGGTRGSGAVAAVVAVLTQPRPSASRRGSVRPDINNERAVSTDLAAAASPTGPSSSLSVIRHWFRSLPRFLSLADDFTLCRLVREAEKRAPLGARGGKGKRRRWASALLADQILRRRCPLLFERSAGTLVVPYGEAVSLTWGGGLLRAEPRSVVPYVGSVDLEEKAKARAVAPPSAVRGARGRHETVFRGATRGGGRGRRQSSRPVAAPQKKIEDVDVEGVPWVSEMVSGAADPLRWVNDSWEDISWHYSGPSFEVVGAGFVGLQGHPLREYIFAASSAVANDTASLQSPLLSFCAPTSASSSCLSPVPPALTAGGPSAPKGSLSEGAAPMSSPASKVGTEPVADVRGVWCDSLPPAYSMVRGGSVTHPAAVAAVAPVAVASRHAALAAVAAVATDAMADSEPVTKANVAQASADKAAVEAISAAVVAATTFNDDALARLMSRFVKGKGSATQADGEGGGTAAQGMVVRDKKSVSRAVTQDAFSELSSPSCVRRALRAFVATQRLFQAVPAPHSVRSLFGARAASLSSGPAMSTKPTVWRVGVVGCTAVPTLVRDSCAATASAAATAKMMAQLYSKGMVDAQYATAARVKAELAGGGQWHELVKADDSDAQPSSGIPLGLSNAASEVSSAEAVSGGEAGGLTSGYVQMRSVLRRRSLLRSGKGGARGSEEGLRPVGSRGGRQGSASGPSLSSGEEGSTGSVRCGIRYDPLTVTLETGSCVDDADGARRLVCGGLLFESARSVRSLPGGRLPAHLLSGTPVAMPALTLALASELRVPLDCEDVEVTAPSPETVTAAIHATTTAPRARKKPLPPMPGTLAPPRMTSKMSTAAAAAAAAAHSAEVLTAQARALAAIAAARAPVDVPRTLEHALARPTWRNAVHGWPAGAVPFVLMSASGQPVGVVVVPDRRARHAEVGLATPSPLRTGSLSASSAASTCKPSPLIVPSPHHNEPLEDAALRALGAYTGRPRGATPADLAEVVASASQQLRAAGVDAETVPWLSVLAWFPSEPFDPAVISTSLTDSDIWNRNRKSVARVASPALEAWRRGLESVSLPHVVGDSLRAQSLHSSRARAIMGRMADLHRPGRSGDEPPRTLWERYMNEMYAAEKERTAAMTAAPEGAESQEGAAVVVEPSAVVGTTVDLFSCIGMESVRKNASSGFAEDVLHHDAVERSGRAPQAVSAASQSDSESSPPIAPAEGGSREPSEALSGPSGASRAASPDAGSVREDTEPGGVGIVGGSTSMAESGRSPSAGGSSLSGSLAPTIAAPPTVVEDLSKAPQSDPSVVAGSGRVGGRGRGRGRGRGARSRPRHAAAAASVRSDGVSATAVSLSAVRPSADNVAVHFGQWVGAVPFASAPPGAHPAAAAAAASAADSASYLAATAAAVAGLRARDVTATSGRRVPLLYKPRLGSVVSFASVSSSMKEAAERSFEAGEAGARRYVVVEGAAAVGEIACADADVRVARTVASGLSVGLSLHDGGGDVRAFLPGYHSHAFPHPVGLPFPSLDNGGTCLLHSSIFCESDSGFLVVRSGDMHPSALSAEQGVGKGSWDAGGGESPTWRRRSFLSDSPSPSGGSPRQAEGDFLSTGSLSGTLAVEEPPRRRGSVLATPLGALLGTPSGAPSHRRTIARTVAGEPVAGHFLVRRAAVTASNAEVMDMEGVMAERSTRGVLPPPMGLSVGPAVRISVVASAVPHLVKSQSPGTALSGSPRVGSPSYSRLRIQRSGSILDLTHNMSGGPTRDAVLVAASMAKTSGLGLNKGVLSSIPSKTVRPESLAEERLPVPTCGEGRAQPSAPISTAYQFALPSAVAGVGVRSGIHKKSGLDTAAVAQRAALGAPRGLTSDHATLHLSRRPAPLALGGEGGGDPEDSSPSSAGDDSPFSWLDSAKKVHDVVPPPRGGESPVRDLTADADGLVAQSVSISFSPALPVWVAVWYCADNDPDFVPGASCIYEGVVPPVIPSTSTRDVLMTLAAAQPALALVPRCPIPDNSRATEWLWAAAGVPAPRPPSAQRLAVPVTPPLAHVPEAPAVIAVVRGVRGAGRGRGALRNHPHGQTSSQHATVNEIPHVPSTGANRDTDDHVAGSSKASPRPNSGQLQAPVVDLPPFLQTMVAPVLVHFTGIASPSSLRTTTRFSVGGYGSLNVVVLQHAHRGAPPGFVGVSDTSTIAQMLSAVDSTASFCDPSDEVSEDGSFVGLDWRSCSSGSSDGAGGDQTLDDDDVSDIVSDIGDESGSLGPRPQSSASTHHADRPPSSPMPRVSSRSSLRTSRPVSRAAARVTIADALVAPPIMEDAPLTEAAAARLTRKAEREAKAAERAASRAAVGVVPGQMDTTRRSRKHRSETVTSEGSPSKLVSPPQSPFAGGSQPRRGQRSDTVVENAVAGSRVRKGRLRAETQPHPKRAGGRAPVESALAASSVETQGSVGDSSTRVAMETVDPPSGTDQALRPGSAVGDERPVSPGNDSASSRVGSAGRVEDIDFGFSMDIGADEGVDREFDAPVTQNDRGANRLQALTRQLAKPLAGTRARVKPMPATFPTAVFQLFPWSVDVASTFRPLSDNVTSESSLARVVPTAGEVMNGDPWFTLYRDAPAILVTQQSRFPVGPRGVLSPALLSLLGGVSLPFDVVVLGTQVDVSAASKALAPSHMSELSEKVKLLRDGRPLVEVQAPRKAPLRRPFRPSPIPGEVDSAAPVRPITPSLQTHSLLPALQSASRSTIDDAGASAALMQVAAAAAHSYEGCMSHVGGLSRCAKDPHEAFSGHNTAPEVVVISAGGVPFEAADDIDGAKGPPEVEGPSSQSQPLVDTSQETKSDVIASDGHVAVALLQAVVESAEPADMASVELLDTGTNCEDVVLRPVDGATLPVLDSDRPVIEFPLRDETHAEPCEISPPDSLHQGLHDDGVKSAAPVRVGGAGSAVLHHSVADSTVMVAVDTAEQPEGDTEADTPVADVQVPVPAVEGTPVEVDVPHVHVQMTAPPHLGVDISTSPSVGDGHPNASIPVSSDGSPVALCSSLGSPMQARETAHTPSSRRRGQGSRRGSFVEQPKAQRGASFRSSGLRRASTVVVATNALADPIAHSSTRRLSASMHASPPAKSSSSRRQSELSDTARDGSHAAGFPSAARARQRNKLKAVRRRVVALRGLRKGDGGSMSPVRGGHTTEEGSTEGEESLSAEQQRRAAAQRVHRRRREIEKQKAAAEAAAHESRPTHDPEAMATVMERAAAAARLEVQMRKQRELEAALSKVERGGGGALVRRDLGETRKSQKGTHGTRAHTPSQKGEHPPPNARHESERDSSSAQGSVNGSIRDGSCPPLDRDSDDTSSCRSSCSSVDLSEFETAMAALRLAVGMACARVGLISHLLALVECAAPSNRVAAKGLHADVGAAFGTIATHMHSAALCLAAARSQLRVCERVRGDIFHSSRTGFLPPRAGRDAFLRILALPSDRWQSLSSSLSRPGTNGRRLQEPPPPPPPALNPPIFDCRTIVVKSRAEHDRRQTLIQRIAHGVQAQFNSDGEAVHVYGTTLEAVAAVVAAVWGELCMFEEKGRALARRIEQSSGRAEAGLWVDVSGVVGADVDPGAVMELLESAWVANEPERAPVPETDSEPHSLEHSIAALALGRSQSLSRFHVAHVDEPRMPSWWQSGIEADAVQTEWNDEDAVAEDDEWWCASVSALWVYVGSSALNGPVDEALDPAGGTLRAPPGAVQVLSRSGSFCSPVTQPFDLASMSQVALPDSGSDV